MITLLPVDRVPLREAELTAQIELRRKLIRECVGQLYPSIMEAETAQLESKLAFLRHGGGLGS